MSLIPPIPMTTAATSADAARTAEMLLRMPALDRFAAEARGYDERRLRAALATVLALVLALSLAALSISQTRAQLDADRQRSLQSLDRLSQLSDAVSLERAAFRAQQLREPQAAEELEAARAGADELLAAIARDALPILGKRQLVAQLSEQLVALREDMDARRQTERGVADTAFRVAEFRETLAALRFQEERTYIARLAGTQGRDHWLKLALGAALLLQLALGALLYLAFRNTATAARSSGVSAFNPT